MDNDDIDDYFDDLVLDEQTLAILDKEEKKYLSQIHSPPPPIAPPPAVTKRQRTRDGWSPGIGSHPRELAFDDLPEISVTADGSYGFTDSVVTTTLSNASQPLSRQFLQNNALLPQPQRQTNQNDRVPLLNPPVPPLRRTVSSVHGHASSISNSPPFAPVPPMPHDNASITTKGPALEKQVAELQAQLLLLRNENQKIQGALKEATDIRHAREGEVSILRKNMEKIAQNHAAEIIKMKADKEAADSRQKQMERQMKEETERLKSHFIFKQHELETALRRPPSVRTTRITKNVPTTPVRVPSQIGAWNPPQNLDSGHIINDTPRGKAPFRSSPRAIRIGQHSPEIKQTAFLPGFSNSFLTTPLKRNMKADSKGKARDPIRAQSHGQGLIDQTASQNTEPVNLITTAFRQGSTDNFGFEGNFDVVPTSDGSIPHVDEDGDTVMLEDTTEEGVEEVELIEPPNHKAELARIILTHAHKKVKEANFQLLIGLPSVANLPDAQATECTRAAQAILFALSHPADNSDYDLCSQQIAKHLLVMLRCLPSADNCSPMVALLDLLRSLSLSLSTFRKAILCQKLKAEDDSLLLATLLDLLDHLSTYPQNANEAPIEDILSLMETLLYDIPDEAVNQLVIIPKRITILLALFNLPQSHFLETLSRVLLLLATYPSIHEQLLTPPGDGSHRDELDHRDSLLVHQLCVHLVENFTGDFTQASVVCSNLLGCLAQFSLTQAERLVDSSIVIPTLIYLITQSSILLWNDDECKLTKLGANSIIRSINQALFLLHHLISATEMTTRLHDKLLHSPHRNLNNLEHLFVVGFGQLSYADPPDWITTEGKAELESFANTARDLLDLVVDGPEGDSVWAAYQMEHDNASETDDEEREARLMDNDIQS